METGIQLIPEINFEIVKFSKKRGTRETFFAKNVVLDSGFTHYLDSVFDAFNGVDSLGDLADPEFLFLGTGTTEPDRSDTGLEAVSTVRKCRKDIASVNGGATNRDPVSGFMYAQKKRTFAWGEGDAEGTWTEAGLAFWDRINTNPSTRGINNTYTFPFSRSLFRKGLERDGGTASAGGASTLSDATKAWTVDAWKDNYTVYITGGTGTGQNREITGNTETEITVISPWDVAPDATSVYEIRGTPTSITVLADEYLTVFAYQRMYFPHAIDAFSGTMVFRGAEIPWSGYVSGTIQSAGSNNALGPTLPKAIRIHYATISSTEVVGVRNSISMDVTFDKAARSVNGSFDFNPGTDDRIVEKIVCITGGTFSYDFLVITPDWSLLPNNLRYDHDSGSQVSGYLPYGPYGLWPNGERLKGGAGFAMFRGD